jgi:predicted Zn-ribbon and HTH transcriptional regulator
MRHHRETSEQGVAMETFVRLRCRECGYGVSARTTPERCPMCGRTEWEHEPWRPFSSLVDDLVRRRHVESPRLRQ